MRAYWTLTRRDLAGYFLSLTGYVVIAATTFLVGLSFVDLLKALKQEPTAMPVTELFYVTWYFWLILLLTTPVITMRLFALEKFSGTFETLMTTPVSDLEVVLAKFSAALIFYALMWLPLLGCVWLVRHYSSGQAALDAGTLGGTFLGILLLGGLFISLGCCASSLTRSQMVAAILTLVLSVSLFLLSVLAEQTQTQDTWQAQVLACFALARQMHDFTRGIVDTQPVVLFVSLTFFFLFLTLRIVESRRWK
jgi:ABC-2 type transport system permease protein